MKRILGLVASQRKQGNGEILTKEVAAAVGDHQLELLRLVDLQLGLCRGCYTCVTPNRQCPIDDGLYYLVGKIEAADGIILSAPCYALGPAAVTKVLSDRILAFAQQIDRMWGKPCVVIGTAGVKGWEGYTSTGLNTIAKFMGFNLKDSHIFMGALPGEAILDEVGLSRVQEMGQSLFGEARKVKRGECPTCWSEAWKFIDALTFACSVCGQRKNLSIENNDVNWTYSEPGDVFSKENLQGKFQQWLSVKLKEFHSRKKEFTEIRERYKGNDVWLKPK